MCDQEYIRQVLNGRQEAFRILVEKYQDMIFRTAVGFVHNREDAEDITQETFLCAFRSLKKFRGEAAFSTWLYRIAINISLDHSARKRKRNLFLETGERLQQALHIRSTEPNPDEKLIGRQTEKSVREALDSLPEKQRIALTLSKYDELPQKEIARILKTTEGAVEQLLQRAKINLQKKLTRP